MLNPHTDRLDYGDKLKAPEGFTLSHAVATTYTLDLETLLCLPLSLSFNCTPEGDVQADKLALLEAISQLKGKVKVFFQQGCIKLPRQFNLLFSLLEPLLVPQVPAEPFSSFHPKLWLLRFSNPAKAVRYRLLVLSRNLTFDRSWDLAVALEGELAGQRSDDNDGLVAMLRSLVPGAGDFQPALELFTRELPRVAWDRPDGFTALRTLPEKPGKSPLAFCSTVDTVMVMSPFLHPDALDLLKQAGARHWLFSRAEEIERLGESRLQGWECFVLNPSLINGEDELSQARPQDLHAKLVLLQEGAVGHWHIGSANATKAALGGTNEPPRNTEFMLRLSSKIGQQSARQLWVELVGNEEAPTGIFIPYRFGALSLTADTSTDECLRRLQHSLIQADWCMRAVVEANGTFTCVIDCPPQLLEHDRDWVIEAQPLVMGQPLKLAQRLVWEGLSLTQVSAFLILRVIPASKEPTELLIKMRLEIEGGDTREQKITSTLIDSPHKLLAYIQMLLHPAYAYPLDADAAGGRGHGTDADAIIGQMLSGPLHEALLRCAARQPEKLQRIDAVLEKLRDTENLIPSGLSALWAQYQQLIWKKKA
ncbi:phospholipase D family protein [Pseudomonas sp. YuFO8]|uniref:phospholipase D family protein n=1 Tax=Pseudomonas sp. YuFO8 TaxID=3095361 RepID=UPI002B24C26C|nr:phospholipase D family protein [Pseudomonas sp. YuFO8]MEB2621386.1 phospholipase D family protein [Pseudomonas sp. YuFO8]